MTRPDLVDVAALLSIAAAAAVIVVVLVSPAPAAEHRQHRPPLRSPYLAGFVTTSPTIGRGQSVRPSACFTPLYKYNPLSPRCLPAR